MIKKVVTVEASTPISEALSLAKKLNIGCLPVLQNKVLIGIITHRDLSRIKNAKGI